MQEIPEPPVFPLVRYFAVLMLFGPMALLAVAWVAMVVASWTRMFSFRELRDSGAGWLTAAIAAGFVCMICEWLILPITVPSGHPRPAWTPLLSFAVGLAIAVPAWLVLKSYL